MDSKIQDLSLFVMPTGFRGRSALIVQLWWFVQATLFRWSPQFAYGFRRALLRFFGADIGLGVIVRPSVTITYPWKVTIGDHAWVGDDVVLYSLGEISIGKNSVVSQRSYICAGDHDYSNPKFPIRALPVVIGPQNWIATDVFVAPGVSIGAGNVVGARSSVFSDLPDGMVCLGSPCRPIKPRVVKDY
ncbi:colanic acid biosynthesis acetyltransferase WcaF [Zoogloea oleivorans]|uniref:Colanic acid biosynthesis acetyltransferase WcaF n=1 Tax=Zoogloea oleivorans TaxID=1552750 RepID=A0A6C2CCN9_9RHOO|nr:putative colanic acid biosynthesis acetyltransferase [Zoogloea oleivorans]TYC51810.1 colanic acid biosynthesis acetyltransferase WcaF [Zoogloea oleivorans]